METNVAKRSEEWVAVARGDKTRPSGNVIGWTVSKFTSEALTTSTSECD